MIYSECLFTILCRGILLWNGQMNTCPIILPTCCQVTMFVAQCSSSYFFLVPFTFPTFCCHQIQKDQIFFLKCWKFMFMIFFLCSILNKICVYCICKSLLSVYIYILPGIPTFGAFGIKVEIVLSIAIITHKKCHWSWKGRKVERLPLGESLNFQGEGGDCSLMCCNVHLLQ